MEHHNLKDMKKGWFVGDFDPTVLRTKDVEVAVKEYKAGDKEQWHYHKVAKEITVVISGEIKMVEQTFPKGDIIVLDPTEATEFHAITDAVTACVKVPCIKDDKFTE